MNSSEKNQIGWKSLIQKYLEKLGYEYKSLSGRNSIEIPFKVNDESITLNIIIGSNEFPESTFITLFTQHEQDQQNSIEKLLEAINDVNKSLPYGCISLSPINQKIHAKVGQRIDSRFIADDLDEMIDFSLFLANHIYKNEYIKKIAKHYNS